MRKTVRKLLVVCMALSALSLAACSKSDGGNTAKGAGGEGSATSVAKSGTGDAIEKDPNVADVSVKIGAQDFGESAILAEIYGQALTARGFKVDQKALGGYRDISMGAFDNNEINFTVEYAASLLEFLNDKAGEATSDATETVGLLDKYLGSRNLVVTENAEAVNTNAFVIRRDTADELGIKTLSDLAAKGADLKLGSPADCDTNPFCLPGLKEVYGLDLSADWVTLDAGVVATALQNKEIDVAVLFSTDGVIADRDWVLLEDDKGMLAADNIIPLMSKSLADEGGDSLINTVNLVTSRLTTDGLIAMNKRFDIDKESARDIASDWLKDQGLVK